MARLKVFRSTQGFFETVVAAPSQKAALEAWGAHQDLFATGAAEAVTDKAAVEAALAQPGVVLRRPVGSTAGFEEGAGVGGIKLPPAKKPATAKAKAEPAPRREKPRPPPDRSALSKAEKALSDRQDRFARDREVVEAKRRALEAEADALRAAYERDRQALEAARAKAEAAYRKAGG